MSQDQRERCLPYLSRIETFQGTLLPNLAPPVMRFEHARIDKSEVGVAGELVNGYLPAKPAENNSQDGHEDSEAESYQCDFEVKSFESLPFCVAEA